jgi:DNA-binding XRE family transcriptional regulator
MKKNIRNSKLTLAQVKQIRKAYASGHLNQSKMARELGVCEKTIYRICHNKTWVKK